jgi:hypothetical protein
MDVPDPEEIPLTFSFSQINDHAFPQEWVEQIFEKLRKPGLFHDIPVQKAVIQVDQPEVKGSGKRVRSLILTIPVLRHEGN